MEPGTEPNGTSGLISRLNAPNPGPFLGKLQYPILSMAPHTFFTLALKTCCRTVCLSSVTLTHTHYSLSLLQAWSPPLAPVPVSLTLAASVCLFNGPIDSVCCLSIQTHLPRLWIGTQPTLPHAGPPTPTPASPLTSVTSILRGGTIRKKRWRQRTGG